jgi:hypothetical protein
MATTYEKIATTTLGSAAASIDFTSIASSWTDLRFVLTGVNSALYAGAYFRLNSDSGSNYSTTALYGNGTSATSYRSSNATQVDLFGAWGGNTSIPQMATVDLFSYAGSTYKTFLWTNPNDLNGNGVVTNGVGLWRSTSAVTAISIICSTGNWNTGTTATLYGIKAA